MCSRRRSEPPSAVHARAALARGGPRSRGSVPGVLGDAHWGDGRPTADDRRSGRTRRDC